jgi:hypothetical protein
MELAAQPRHARAENETLIRIIELSFVQCGRT